ncbi:ParA family protein [Burkholderia sp. BCC0322]|uniref:ParA family protein n=1 Tax=unclassified Burkholderia TaxID=2613784 RepID=UPI001ABA17E1|nr:AAA family ATPase [Burkholderia sp. BCC0322]
MTAIRRLCDLEFDREKYEKLTVFIDCNPSFSICTQMALVSADRLIVPMMADFSSLEGGKSLMMLLYGKYPSAALKTYAEDMLTFNSQAKSFGLPLPVLYEFVFNNFTTNSGVAYAFESVRNELVEFCYQQYVNYPSLFAPCSGPISSKADWEDYFIANTKDFHTSAKVSASLGIPLHKLPESGNYVMPDGTSVPIPAKNYAESLKNVVDFVSQIQ